MRTLALIAFLGLQLSMFTCGIDIHMDHMDGTAGQIAHSRSDESGHGADSMDRVCQIHASSHVFTDQAPFSMRDAATPPERIYHLATLSLVNIPHLIEHPPRLLHG